MTPTPPTDGTVEQSPDALLARVGLALDAIGEALMHCHFALDDSEDRSGDDPPVHHVPHDSFVALCEAMEKCGEFEEAFAEPRTVWDGPGPLAGCIKRALARPSVEPSEAMIERVARAIAANCDITPFDRLTWSETRHYLETARAAIAVLQPVENKR